MNTNTFIPPGSTGNMGRASLGDARTVLTDRFQNPDTIEKKVAKMNMSADQKANMLAEFSNIDSNRDGNLSREELKNFFINKGITDEQQLFSVVDDIYEMLDEDGDGTISLDEFVNKFMETREKLEARKTECAHKMIDHDRQEQEVEIKLEEVQDEELNEQGIRNDSKLKVHIVDAVNLDPEDVIKDYQIKCFQGNAMSETKSREGPGPIWNEAILFDIKDASQPVIVQIIREGRQEEVVFQTEISLAEGMIRDYTLQGSDVWCYAEPQNVCSLTDAKSQQQYFWYFDPETGRSEPIDAPEDAGFADSARLRLRVHYSYSDVQRFNALLTEWRQQIADDIDEYLEIKTCLEHLSNPFVFFTNISTKAGIALSKAEQEDMEQQAQGDNKYHLQEKELERQVDEIAASAAKSVGYRDVPWNGIVYVALVVQMILAMLSQYARKDQITITACALGFYFMEFPETLRRHRFRQLVAMFLVSLVYDLVWYFVVDDQIDDEGGVEGNIKKFSRIMGYISFCFRIILSLLLEKASLNFVTIVKGKKNDLKIFSDLDNKIIKIMEAHEKYYADDDGQEEYPGQGFDGIIGRQRLESDTEEEKQKYNQF